MNGDHVTWVGAAFFWFLVPLAFFCVLLLIQRFVWQKKLAVLLGGVGREHSHLKGFSLTRKFLKTLFFSGGLFFLVIALGRPQWGNEDQKISQEGRDVLIALDISRSMLAQDCKPNRLACAQAKIKELIANLAADRVCFLVFSSSALVQCPFTRDQNAVLNFLDLADVESISSGSTNLKSALETVLSAFKNGSQARQKIAVLFTDGEDFSGDLSSIKKKARDHNLHLFIVGVGSSEGAPIPLYDDIGSQRGHQKDEQGKIVISRLDEPLLRDLADKIGGAYIPLSQSSDDVKELVSFIREYATEKYEDTTHEAKPERYALFAFFAFLLVVLEWIL